MGEELEYWSEGVLEYWANLVTLTPKLGTRRQLDSRNETGQWNLGLSIAIAFGRTPAHLLGKWVSPCPNYYL